MKWLALASKITLLILTVYVVNTALEQNLIDLFNAVSILIIFTILGFFLIPYLAKAYSQVEDFIGSILYAVTLFYLSLPFILRIIDNSEHPLLIFEYQISENYFLPLGLFIPAIICFIIASFFRMTLGFVCKKMKWKLSEFYTVITAISTFITVLIAVINSPAILEATKDIKEGIYIFDFSKKIRNFYAIVPSSFQSLLIIVISSFFALHIDVLKKIEKENSEL